MLLVGDIGATKTILALFTKTDPNPVAEMVYRSAAAPELGALVQGFLTQTKLPLHAAAFGVAGPVTAGQASVTNLNWPAIQPAQLAAELGLTTVVLLNDLEAIAWAVPALQATDLHTLHEGQPEPAGAIAVIAPGTGLGEAFLSWDGQAYQPHPSEGGNVDFAPTSRLQTELLTFLMHEYDQVSYELVCSGLGIPNLYRFLRTHGEHEPAWLAERLAEAADPTAVIMTTALLADAPPICAATLALFVEILGAEAGNLALKVLATGGIYLGGGIPPRILPALSDGRLLGALHRKGPFSQLLRHIPVHVIANSRVALLGARRALLARLAVS